MAFQKTVRSNCRRRATDSALPGDRCERGTIRGSSARKNVTCGNARSKEAIVKRIACTGRSNWYKRNDWPVCAGGDGSTHGRKTMPCAVVSSLAAASNHRGLLAATGNLVSSHSSWVAANAEFDTGGAMLRTSAPAPTAIEPTAIICAARRSAGLPHAHRPKRYLRIAAIPNRPLSHLYAYFA